MSSSAEIRRPPFRTLVARGITRRCAWCGGRRAFFTGWFKKADRCQSCGVRWARNLEGFELGAATMGVFFTFGSVIGWMVLSLLFSVPLVPLLVVASSLAVLVPVFSYPLTYTLWFGVHLAMNELSAEELVDAEIWRMERGR